LEANEAKSLSTYNEALRQLEIEGKIQFQNGYVTISKKFLADSNDPKIRLVNLSRNAPRTLFSSFFGTFPQLINIISHNTEAFLKTQKINWRKQREHPYPVIDPQKYVFFQTARG